MSVRVQAWRIQSFTSLIDFPGPCRLVQYFWYITNSVWRTSNDFFKNIFSVLNMYFFIVQNSVYNFIKEMATKRKKYLKCLTDFWRNVFFCNHIYLYIHSVTCMSCLFKACYELMLSIKRRKSWCDSKEQLVRVKFLGNQKTKRYAYFKQNVMNSAIFQTFYVNFMILLTPSFLCIFSASHDFLGYLEEID